MANQQEAHVPEEEDVEDGIGITLTANAATANRHHTRVRMQVVDMALLKYEIVQTPREVEGTVRYNTGCKIPYELPIYRFILSDGSHLAPAKFLHENSDYISRDGQSKSLTNACSLVESGVLKKGTIISFIPKRLGPGDGVIIMSSLLVEGWSELLTTPTGRELQAIHSEVAAYSGRNVHSCTMSPSLLAKYQSDPIPREVLHLAKIIKDLCGECTITGSAPLAQFLKDAKGCEHCLGEPFGRIHRMAACNDVDLFVPMYPDSIIADRDGGMDEQARIERVDFRSREEQQFLDGVLPRAFDLLYEQHGLRHTKIVVTDFRRRQPLDGIDYSWMSLVTGLIQKIEFKLVTSSGQEISSPVQILTMDAFPSSPEQNWDDLVTSHFDINVITGVAKMADDSSKLDKITFSDAVQASIMTGEFEFSMRPCETFEEIFRRMQKYKKRGFHLAKLDFEPSVSNAWRWHVLSLFHAKYGEVWFQEMNDKLRTDNAEDAMLPPEIYHAKIFPFLHDQMESKSNTVLRNRRLLRDEVCAEMERRDWRDAGYHKVLRTRLESLWAHADEVLQREADGVLQREADGVDGGDEDMNE